MSASEAEMLAEIARLKDQRRAARARGELEILSDLHARIGQLSDRIRAVRAERQRAVAAEEQTVNAEIDRLVAEHVMGWCRAEVEYPAYAHYRTPDGAFVPDPAQPQCALRVLDWRPTASGRDMARVVDQMRAKGYDFWFSALATGYRAVFRKRQPRRVTGPRWSKGVRADEPGEAIARAALRALGVGEDKNHAE